MKSSLASSALLLVVLSCAIGMPVHAANPSMSWWKGNLHTHTFWSDGNDFPEMIAEWYRTNGYHFLVLSDHNILQEGEKWVSSKGREEAIMKYKARFGEDWVTERKTGAAAQVRLKTLEEFRPRLEVPGSFLMMTGEEITDQYQSHPVHLNAYQLKKLIRPQGGTSVVDVIQRNIDAVLAQRKQSDVPIIPHINHPNFHYAITAEDFMKVRGERFFEVYNGHPSVYNNGDEFHVSLERMWDILLAFRLTSLNEGLLFGLAVDDAHHYHHFDGKRSNPGRGWIMVRAASLRPRDLLEAMEDGDFYATTGVLLRDIEISKKRLLIRIRKQPGVTFTTRFIGTRRGFDTRSEPGKKPPNHKHPVTRQYSEEIGTVLAEVKGARARYRFKGDEIYVRAHVISSKPKANATVADETEMAWTQPVVPVQPAN